MGKKYMTLKNALSYILLTTMVISAAVFFMPVAAESSDPASYDTASQLSVDTSDQLKDSADSLVQKVDTDTKDTGDQQGKVQDSADELVKDTSDQIKKKTVKEEGGMEKYDPIDGVAPSQEDEAQEESVEEDEPVEAPAKSVTEKKESQPRYAKKAVKAAPIKKSVTAPKKIKIVTKKKTKKKSKPATQTKTVEKVKNQKYESRYDSPTRYIVGAIAVVSGVGFLIVQRLKRKA